MRTSPTRAARLLALHQSCSIIHGKILRENRGVEIPEEDRILVAHLHGIMTETMRQMHQYQVPFDEYNLVQVIEKRPANAIVDQIPMWSRPLPSLSSESLKNL